MNVVFQRNGNAVEGAAVAMTFAAARCEEFRFGFLGLSESKFRGDGDVSVQLGIKLLDACKHKLSQVHRRKLSLAKKFSDFLDGGKREIGVIPAQNIFS